MPARPAGSPTIRPPLPVTLDHDSLPHAGISRSVDCRVALQPLEPRLLGWDVYQIQTAAQPCALGVSQLRRASNEIIRKHQPQRAGANVVGEVMRTGETPASRELRRRGGALCHEIK